MIPLIHDNSNSVNLKGPSLNIGNAGDVHANAVPTDSALRVAAKQKNKIITRFVILV